MIGMIVDYKLNFADYQKKIIENYSGWEYECPNCHNKNCFHRHGIYDRYFSTWEEDGMKTIKVRILRLKCSCCNTTHAVLAGDMIPYRIFAQSVFVKILSMLFLGNSTISQTSSKIKISYQMIQGILTVVNNYKENIRKLISTLYRISVETLSAGEVVRYLQEVPLYLQGEYIKRYKTVMFMGRNKKMLCGSA
jgi:hypothetical protein